MSNPTPSAPVQQGGMEITAEERVSEENPSQCDIPFFSLPACSETLNYALVVGPITAILALIIVLTFLIILAKTLTKKSNQR